MQNKEGIMPLKWGVIGAGGIAERRTIPEGITKARNATLVAVMDVDETRAKKIGSEYKALRDFLGCLPPLRQTNNGSHRGDID